MMISGRLFGYTAPGKRRGQHEMSKRSGSDKKREEVRRLHIHDQSDVVTLQQNAT
jgi:hypothetical protein